MSSLEVNRGDSPSFQIPVTKSDGSPQDLTGAELWFTVKANRYDDDTLALIRKGTSGTGGLSGITKLTNPPGTNYAQLDLSAADTLALDAPAAYWWDLQCRISGKIFTVDQGRLFAGPQVTVAS